MKKKYGVLLQNGRYIPFWDDTGEMWMHLYGHSFVADRDPQKESQKESLKKNGFVLEKKCTYKEYCEHTKWKEDD